LSPPWRYCEYFSKASKATKKLAAIFESWGQWMGASLIIGSFLLLWRAENRTEQLEVSVMRVGCTWI
jgi:hypothetical protein